MSKSVYNLVDNTSSFNKELSKFFPNVDRLSFLSFSLNL